MRHFFLFLFLIDIIFNRRVFGVDAGCCDCLFAFAANSEIFVLDKFSEFITDPASASFQWEKVGQIPALNPEEETTRIFRGAIKTNSGGWITVYQNNILSGLLTVLNPDLSTKQRADLEISGFAFALRSSGVVDECGILRGYLQSSTATNTWIGYIVNPDMSFNTRFELIDASNPFNTFFDSTMTPSAYDFENQLHYGVGEGGNFLLFNYAKIRNRTLPQVEPFRLGNSSGALNFVSIFFETQTKNPKLWGIGQISENNFSLFGPSFPSERQFNTSTSIPLPLAPARLISFDFGCPSANLKPCTSPIVDIPFTVAPSVLPGPDTVPVAIGVAFGVVSVLLVVLGVFVGSRLYLKAKEKRETAGVTELTDVEVGAQLGSGNFGTVFKGQLQKSTDVALKKLKDGQMDEFFAELRILIKANHPNVVRLFGVYNASNVDHYLVYEFISGGSVDKFFQQYSEEIQIKDLLFMIEDLIAGVKFLHSLKVIHRDLSARNLLVKEEHGRWTLKIADFGLSQNQDSGKEASHIALRWAAPEILSGGKFTTKSDIWSVGVCMWEIFSRGKYPYANKTDKQVLEFLESENRLEQPSECPDLVYQLMGGCWREDPKDRPEAEFLRERVERIVGNYNHV